MQLDPALVVERLHAARGSRQVRFVAIGDAIVDRTIRVERTERKLSLGDGTFLRVKSVETELGGVPTVARVLAAIGTTTMVIPVCNRGGEVSTLQRLLSEDKTLAAVETLRLDCQDWVTPSVTRYLELDFLRRDHQIFRVEERPERVPTIDAIALTNGCLQAKISTLVLSDYGRGFITSGICSAVRNANIGRVILDPAGQWSIYRELGNIHTLLVRSDQLGDLCAHEGIHIDPVSALDRRVGVLHVLERWPQLRNVVVKDHGTAETTGFLSREVSGARFVDIVSLKKKDRQLREKLGGGTAFAGYMSAAVGTGLGMMDAVLAGECGALTMSLLEQPGVPSIEEVFRLRKETMALFSVESEGAEEIAAAGRFGRDFL